MKKKYIIPSSTIMKALMSVHVIASSSNNLEIHGGLEPTEGTETVSTEEQNARRQIMDDVW